MASKKIGNQKTRNQKKIFSLSTFPLKDKTLFLRVDYNVPLQNQKVTDNTKIKASLPTIKYLLQKNCKIILATHLGRPEGKIVPELKTDPLAQELKKLLPQTKITKLDECCGPKIKEAIKKGKNKEIFLLENLRFHPEETENNLQFAHSLAALADFYVNDAFAVSHRQEASVDAITNFLPSAPGFLFQKEIKALSPALTPQHPLVWLVGGTKEDKTYILPYLLKKADYILIGSGLYPFLVNKTQKPKTQNKKTTNKKIILPSDLNQTYDIGPKTIQLFQTYLQKARTIVWNGPLGKFEDRKFALGSQKIAIFISKLKVTKIIGGGETSEMINKFKLSKKMTWVSTGGGASLKFLTGKKLPGLAALEKNYQKFRNKVLKSKI